MDEKHQAEDNSSSSNMVLPQGYLNLGRIAKALMGAVYLAQHLASGQQVAVKVADRNRCHSVENMEAEAIILHSLQTSRRTKNEVEKETELLSPHIIHFVEYTVFQGRRYLVTEFMPGGDMQSFIKGGRMKDPPRQCRLYFTQLVRAVSFIHARGYAHLDISLENLLLDVHGESIKLADFGLARRVAPSELISFAADQKRFRIPPVKTYIGKATYMAPEVYVCYQDFKPSSLREPWQLERLTATTPITPARLHTDRVLPFDAFAADVFSMGSVLLTMLTQLSPWEKPVVTDKRFRWMTDGRMRKVLQIWGLDQAVSSDAEDLITALIDIRPAQRPPVEVILNHAWLFSQPQAPASSAEIVSQPQPAAAAESQTTKETATAV